MLYGEVRENTTKRQSLSLNINRFKKRKSQLKTLTKPRRN